MAVASECQHGHPDDDSERLVAEQRPDGIFGIRPQVGHPLRAGDGDHALQTVDWSSQQELDIGCHAARIGGGNVQKLQADPCNNGTRRQQRPISEHPVEPAHRAWRDRVATSRRRSSPGAARAVSRWAARELRRRSRLAQPQRTGAAPRSRTRGCDRRCPPAGWRPRSETAPASRAAGTGGGASTSAARATTNTSRPTFGRISSRPADQREGDRSDVKQHRRPQVPAHHFADQAIQRDVPGSPRHRNA